MQNACSDCGTLISRKASRCQSCRMKAQWSDPVRRAKQAKVVRRACHTPEAQAKAAAALRGKPKSPAHRAKIAKRNREIGAEQRAKMAASLKVRGERQREATWAEAAQVLGPDECWEWQGTRFKGSGYGRLGAEGRTHVIAWERENGPVPDGLCVLHRCDNPPCVNPAHLYVGTHADNARDRKLRDRGVKGQRVNTNKLTEKQVYEIRARCDCGERHVDVARRFGVSQTMVSFIARRASWAWLPEK